MSEKRHLIIDFYSIYMYMCIVHVSVILTLYMVCHIGAETMLRLITHVYICSQLMGLVLSITATIYWITISHLNCSK